MSDHATLRIGISACLAGHAGSCHSGQQAPVICNQILAQHIEFISICPGQAAGDCPGDSHDTLAQLQQQPVQQGICGFILVDAHGCPAGATERAALAATLMEENPGLPLEQAPSLYDPVLLENFITRVYAYARWQQLQQQGLTRQALTRFHQRYKYQLMATHREQYQALGRTLANSSASPLDGFAPVYICQLMIGLKRPATRGSHSNVLQHLAGYLKRALNTAQKQELQQLITQYRTGLVPLAAPITLLKQHFQRHPHPYIAEQAYLQPHPEALGLLNAI